MLNNEGPATGFADCRGCVRRLRVGKDPQTSLHGWRAGGAGLPATPHSGGPARRPSRSRAPAMAVPHGARPSLAAGLGIALAARRQAIK